MSTFERVRIVIANELTQPHAEIDPSDLTIDTHLMNDLGADSLDTVEIAMGIEDEFGIDIEDREAEKLKTIRDIVNLIELKKAV